MDHFIADTVRKTILFIAGEGRESTLSRKLFETIFVTTVMCSPGGIVKGSLIEVGKVQSNHTLLNSSE